MDMIYEVDTDVVQIDNTIEVTAEVQNFVIATDDIYIIKRNANIPEWFQSILDNSIESSNLATSVSQLSTLFSAYQDGVTKEIGELRDRDTNIVYDLSVLKTSNTNLSSGIQRLDQVKITADEARAASEVVLASWLNSGGSAAWFNEKVQTVSTVAYAAARSASALTATINTSVLPSLQKAFGEISVLQSQVDGKVETWYGLESPVLGDGSINVTAEPYATWLLDGTIAVHTGDTYVHYELDVYRKKKILATYRFMYDTEDEAYEWYVFTDDIASVAYEAALNAQGTADSKITTWYQESPPIFTTEIERYNAEGDIWVDKDDNNKYYRYTIDAAAPDGYRWVAIDDKRISASVTRLDEATVSVDGVARAKSSLNVNANGVIAGYVADAGTTSSFNIFADTFKVTNAENTVGAAPFEIDTVNNKVKFVGSVEFSSVTGGLTDSQQASISTSMISNDLGWTDNTIADLASSSATAARGVADQAALDAIKALAELSDISSDSVLVPSEKTYLIPEVERLLEIEHLSLLQQAALYNITTETTAYEDKVQALSLYLSTLTTPVAWNNTSGNTDVVDRLAFNQKFTDVYAAKQVLLTKIAIEAKDVADSKPDTYAQATEPTGIRIIGDLWINTASGNLLNRWDGIDWVTLQDVGIETLNTLLAEVDEIARNAMTAAEFAQATADGAISTYYQEEAPIGLGENDIGDMWYASNDNTAWRWTGTAWTQIIDTAAIAALEAASRAQASADGKITSFYGDVFPNTAGEGDLFYHTTDGNKPYYYDGATWISIQDGDIAEAKTIADEAKLDASNALQALTDIASDNIFSPIEKQSALKEWYAIQDEYTKTTALAISWGIDYSAYKSAYDNLSTYLTSVAITAVNTSTTIVGTYFRSVWLEYYKARQTIADKLTAYGLKPGDAASDINNNTTTIDGGKITTGSISADQIAANSITAEHIQTGSITVDQLNFSTEANRIAFADGLGPVLLESTDFMQRFFSLANQGAVMATNSGSGSMYFELGSSGYINIWRSADRVYLYFHCNEGYTRYTASMYFSPKAAASTEKLYLAMSGIPGYDAGTYATTYPSFSAIPTAQTRLLNLYYGGSGSQKRTVSYAAINSYLLSGVDIINYNDTSVGGMATKIGRTWTISTDNSGIARSLILPIGVYAIKEIITSISATNMYGYVSTINMTPSSYVFIDQTTILSRTISIVEHNKINDLSLHVRYNRSGTWYTTPCANKTLTLVKIG